MPQAAQARKVKCSFTLTHQAADFLRQTREERKTRSASETLEQLLEELILARKREELDRAITEFYDNAPDEVLAEERAWAQNSAADMWIGIPE
jgi:hypothetical protein